MDNNLGQVEYLAKLHGAKTTNSKNVHGRTVVRADFGDQMDHLEAFMLDLIGNSYARGISSKAIGGVILLWYR